MLAKQLIMAIDDLIKSNPDGINQYTAGGGSNDKADAAIRTPEASNGASKIAVRSAAAMRRSPTSPGTQR